MKRLRLAVIGCGFWSQYQTAAWRELAEYVEIVAVCDKHLEKARSVADHLNILNYYVDPDELFAKERLDFVDIITDPDSHAPLVFQCADQGVDVICQKPMAPTFELAEAMVKHCQERGVSFFIHENFRWQQPMRELKMRLDQGEIGVPFKANIKFCSSFPVFDNQPLLAQLKQFILTDVGTHILDLSRFLFGEVSTLYCQTQRINPDIKGEDVANVFLRHENGVHCYAEMSYASKLRDESFPETFVLIEGHAGSLYLGQNFEIHTTTSAGTQVEKIDLESFRWAHPDYDLAHSSIYYCHKNILDDLLDQGQAETTGSDNLKTVRLVFDAYESALRNELIKY